MSIGGVPWKNGSHCLYRAGAGHTTLLGKVLVMFHGKDDMMDDFVLFQLKNMRITTHMGHYCLFSCDTQRTDLVLWSEISWKCKVFEGRGRAGDMALPYASCTTQELVQFLR